QATAGGLGDAFAAKLDATIGSLVYSTYLGGSSADVGLAIGVDSAGAAYVAGHTISTDFPLQAPFQSSYAGGFQYGDAFVTKLAASGAALDYSSYLGGSLEDHATAVAVDAAAGNTWVAGATASGDFPTVLPFQTALAGAQDAFVAR